MPVLILGGRFHDGRSWAPLCAEPVLVWAWVVVLLPTRVAASGGPPFEHTRKSLETMEGGSASVYLSTVDERGERENGGMGERGNWGKGRTRVTKSGLVQKNKHIAYRLAVSAASAVGVVERDSLDDTGDRSGGRPSTNPRLLICWLGDGFNECPMDGASTGFIAGVVEARRAR